LLKRCHSGLSFRIISRYHQHPDPPHALALLRPRHERPRSRRTAECGKQFPPSDVACHVTLRLGVIHAIEDYTTLPTARGQRRQGSERAYVFPFAPPKAGLSPDLKTTPVATFGERRHRGASRRGVERSLKNT